MDPATPNRAVTITADILPPGGGPPAAAPALTPAGQAALVSCSSKPEPVRCISWWTLRAGRYRALSRGRAFCPKWDLLISSRDPPTRHYRA
jgi:hypothetical protein